MNNKLSLISILFNAVGILFGVAGSYLIWKHGIPPADIEHDGIALESQDTAKELLNRNRHARQSRRGILSLLIGFALQFVSAVLSIFTLK